MPTFTPKWTDEHRAFIMPLWDAGNTAAFIAQQVNAKFGMTATRNAIIGVVSRAGGKPRANNGIWRLAGAQKRAQTMVANGGYTGGKKRTPVLKPSSEALAPIGPVDDFVAMGCCKWPVSQEGQPFQQCGHPSEHNRPYCSAHSQIAFTPNHSASRSMASGNRAAKQFR